MSKKWMLFGLFILAGMLITFTTTASQAQTGLTPKEELGMNLYFDETLSEPAGQSCASCHHPDFGFADPDKGLPVSEGVIPGLFGGRNSPSSAYAMFSPTRYFDEVEGLWIGGQFWDSRATGEVLGDPLADQAIQPFLNPVEMANTIEGVLEAIKDSDYYETHFVPECGEINLIDPAEVMASYDCVGLAIAAFERTEMFAPFTSKYDYYLQQCLTMGGTPDECAKGTGPIAPGVAQQFFTKKEWYGMQLFMGENNNDGVLEEGEGAMCAACHVADWIDATLYGYPDNLTVVIPVWAPKGWVPPVFTDFTYDNLGIPMSEHKLLAGAPVDLGLGSVVCYPTNQECDPEVGEEDEYGKFKVMTLRNIHQTAPYGHNGFFAKLEDITHFYNTRDVEDWPDPEYPDTMNMDELGSLGLSDKDEDALVKFMKTLTDGWMP